MCLVSAMSSGRPAYEPAVWLLLVEWIGSSLRKRYRPPEELPPGLLATCAVWVEVICAELCGTGHFGMRGKVVVQEESEYQAWLRKQKTFAQLSERARQAKATQ